MGYPLAKLPYGLHYRLFELAIPMERHMLNEAGGSNYRCPKDLLPTYIDFPVCLVIKRDSGQYIHQFKPLKANELAVCSKHLSLKDQNFESLQDPIFSQIQREIIMEPRIVSFDKSTLSKPFIKKVAAMTSGNVKNVYIDAANRDGWELMDVLREFPKTLMLTIEYNAPASWMKDLLKWEKRLKFLYIFDCYAFKDTTEPEFTAFMKAQRKGFILEVNHQTKEKMESLCGVAGKTSDFYGSKKVLIDYDMRNATYYFD